MCLVTSFFHIGLEFAPLGSAHVYRNLDCVQHE